MHRSSLGQALSDTGWLDVHFEACRPEYAAMLEAAPLDEGWTVLDAGCGSGSYLPLLRDRVGGSGRVLALDAAMENLVCVRDRDDCQRAKVGAVGGSVRDLPVRDGTLDAIWCANVSQYFDDVALLRVLESLRRALKPGGVLALKDVDMTAWRIEPAPPLLGAHLAEACLNARPVAPESIGSLRGRALRSWLERAGFVNVWQRSFPIERWAPLDAAGLDLWSQWLPYLAALAEGRGVPERDLDFWRRVATPETARRFIAQDGFYACELQVLALGQTPGAAEMRRW